MCVCVYENEYKLAVQTTYIFYYTILDELHVVNLNHQLAKRLVCARENQQSHGSKNEKNFVVFVK